MATERGKIGRLSVELRNAINGMIRDNRTHEDIIALLESKGIAGVEPQNISSWKKWGYDRWIKRQEAIEQMKSRMEFATELAKDCNGSDGAQLMGDAAARLAMDHITAALESFEPERLQALLAEKPEKLMGLMDTLSNMRAVEIKYQEFRRKVKAAIEQVVGLATEKGSATAEDIKGIFAEAYGV